MLDLDSSGGQNDDFKRFVGRKADLIRLMTKQLHVSKLFREEVVDLTEFLFDWLAVALLHDAFGYLGIVKVPYPM